MSTLDRFDQLEDAILDNDQRRVIVVLSDWTEAERNQAWPKYTLLAEAMGWRHRLGLHDHNSQDDLSTKRAALTEKVNARAEQLGPMLEYFRSNPWTFYVELRTTLDFAYVGLCLDGFRPDVFESSDDLLALVPDLAKIIIDRRPPWFDHWYQTWTSDLAWNMSYVLWVCLYDAGLINWNGNLVVLERLCERFYKPFKYCNEPAKKLLREFQPLRDRFCSLLPVAHPDFFRAWCPAAEYLSTEGLIDRESVVRITLQRLQKTKKKSDRNSLMKLIRAVNATGSELAPFQEELIRLLADPIEDIAGLAVLQLEKIAISKLLRAEFSSRPESKVVFKKTIYAKALARAMRFS